MMRSTATFPAWFVGALLVALTTPPVSAHPGSGIVVDEHDNVWFMDTGYGIWRIDPAGRLSACSNRAGHFLTLDRQPAFTTKHFAKLERGDVEIAHTEPTLIIARSYPVAVGSDGAFYYPRVAKKGRVQIMRMPAGEEARPFADLPPAQEIGTDGQTFEVEWIWGLAAGPDSALYYTQQQSVHRVSPDGTVKTVAEKITVPDCERPEELKHARSETNLYGVAVTQDGVVYAAAPGCSAVLRITADGMVSVALRATNRWAPQGVAVKGDKIYVLEYDYVDSDNRADWYPRVRCINASGTVTTLATVTERPKQAGGTNRGNASAARLAAMQLPVQTAAQDFDGSSAGQQRTVAGMPLRWCPPGGFEMGSPQSELERRPFEFRVPVTLTRGFWTGAFEVTQGDWKRIVGKLPGDLTAELPAGNDLPVGNVSFAEAEDFCARLTKAARAAGELPTGWEFRLPTEAQWEYACRAGTTTATSFGDSLGSQQANIKGDKPYNGGKPGPTLGRASKVGSYPANPWGLYDMHGNTCEWCRDWFHWRYPGGIDPDLHEDQATATKNRTGDISRSRRGSCWADDAWASRSAFRQRFEPHRRYDHIGFRVVLVRI